MDDPQGNYVVADGAALPFPDCHFDMAVAYNVLQVALAGISASRSRIGGLT